jgi:hypothetical protein
LRHAIPLRLAIVLIAGLIVSACDNGDTPTNPSPNPTVTETFTGTLTRNGAQIHPFIATAQGTVTATITAVSPADSPAFGFSMGTYDIITGICTAVVVNRNATLSAVHSGSVVGISSLCVHLFDASGTIPADVPVEYTVTVVRP